jgi:tetratricopeptide (TPR) repeat protein
MKRMQDIVNEPLSMSIYNTDINNEETINGLNGRFVHSQLLIDCLLRMQPTPTDKNDFISLCLKEYNENQSDLKMIDKFEKEYSSDQLLLWYTKDSFLYRLLNKSLRVQNIDSLFGLRFLIRNIAQQLQNYQCQLPMTLYRGQRILPEELEVLKQSKGKLISINPFFSTTRDREVAHAYIGASDDNPVDKEVERVLFEIYANPCRDGVKPFADISSFSAFPDEEEVLMMLGSVFRINDIIHLGEGSIWIVNMTLCSDNDHDLKSVFDHMKNQYGTEQTRLLLFGHVLVDMGHFNDAENYYRRLLNELPSDHTDISHCYHALGKVACEKGDYESSLQLLYKSLEIAEQTLKKGHPQLGFIHTGIGEVCQKKGENDQALKSYEKALQIWIKPFSIDHEYIAWCYNNIAIIYDAQKKYFEALDYHKKALNIKQNILPLQHPCLGNTYLNIGNVYYHLGKYDRALDNYRLSYKIYGCSLTPVHPTIGNVMRNIGIIYEVKGDYDEALKIYKKVSSIRQKRFLSSHPDSVEIEKDIQRVLSKKQ